MKNHCQKRYGRTRGSKSGKKDDKPEETFYDWLRNVSDGGLDIDPHPQVRRNTRDSRHEMSGVPATARFTNA